MDERGQGSAVTLQLPEYDMNCADVLANELDALNGALCVVDFRNVTYFDTSAMTVLIRAAKRLRAEDPGMQLVLQNLSAQMRRLFAIAGLDRYFEISE